MKLAQEFKKGFERVCNYGATIAIAIQGIADALKEYEENCKSGDNEK